MIDTMEFEKCEAAGHVTEDEDDHTCSRCDADRCPVCLAWFVDYDTFLIHMEAED
jgi:hypothetical protein